MMGLMKGKEGPRCLAPCLARDKQGLKEERDKDSQPPPAGAPRGPRGPAGGVQGVEGHGVEGHRVEGPRRGSKENKRPRN